MSGDEKDSKTDLTRIEDLSEYLHSDDPDVDSQLGISDEPTAPDQPLPEYETEAPPMPEEELDIDDEGEGFSTEEDHEDTTEFTDADSAFIDGPSDLFEDDQTDTSVFDSEDDDSTFDQGEEEDSPFPEPPSFEELETIENADVEEDPPSFESEEEMDSDETTIGGDSFLEEDDQSEQTFDSDPEQEESSPPESPQFGGPQESTVSISQEDQEYPEMPEEENTPPTSFDQPEEKEYAPSPFDSMAKTPAPLSRDEPYTGPENFEDVRKFGENITYGQVAMGGNPPFSIIVKNIKFSEDAEGILAILSEHELIKGDDDEKIYQTGVQQGQVIIPQIGEYAAIYLAHRLRRFDVDIYVGLSEAIYPSKAYNEENRGLISRENLKQNSEAHVELHEAPLTLDEIKISTASQIDRHKIVKYLKVITSSLLVDSEELESHELEGPDGHFEQLAELLKGEAQKLHSNAIIGVHYQVTPIGKDKYQIMCSGSAVKANYIGD